MSRTNYENRVGGKCLRNVLGGGRARSESRSAFRLWGDYNVGFNEVERIYFKWNHKNLRFMRIYAIYII